MRFRIGRILGWIARYQCVFMVLSLLLTLVADEISIQKKNGEPPNLRFLVEKKNAFGKIGRTFLIGLCVF